jgi:tol-pal system protein YbgF
MLRKSSIFKTSILFTTMLMLNYGELQAAEFVPNLAGRLDAIERRLDSAQPRQPVNSSTNTSALVEISAMQEEMRSLRGAVEETRFAIDQLQREMKLAGEDTEYRLKALEQKGTTGAASAFGDEEPAPAAIPPVSAVPAIPTTPATPPAPPAVVTPPAPAVVAPTAPVPTAVNADDASREHYNFAVGLIREKRFDRARDSFKQFIASYPSHALVGNAYYWLGETYYVENNYPLAAESFKKGFESKTDGIKAADNLYKLAKSLLNMDKKAEACIVLDQLQKRYKQRNPEVVNLAYETQKASSCQ